MSVVLVVEVVDVEVDVDVVGGSATMSGVAQASWRSRCVQLAAHPLAVIAASFFALAAASQAAKLPGTVTSRAAQAMSALTHLPMSFAEAASHFPSPGTSFTSASTHAAICVETEDASPGQWLPSSLAN